MSRLAHRLLDGRSPCGGAAPAWGNGLRRRQLLAGLCAAVPASGAGAATPRATPPAPVLLMRHALTEPGVGDPPGFVLGRCSTQRNLSAEGRSQARALGARLAGLGLRPAALRSSRWCRCLHTGDELRAGLGAGAPAATEPWPALDSIFEDRAREAAQNEQLRQRLRGLRLPTFELWVSHQVNISALTGRPIAMGQALWIALRDDGTIAATPFD